MGNFSVLSQKKQFVRISYQLPSPIEMSFGVSQGSIFSPILFLEYVNDFGSSLLHEKLVQYADDTTLCFNGKANKF